MRLSSTCLGVLLVPSCLAVAGAASAQPAPVAAATRASQSQQAELRSQISIMEGILERAVFVGIRSVVNQMPDLFQGPVGWAPPTARGFKIDGYGVFFAVEVPTLPASTWSIAIINRNNDIAVANELNQLRAVVQSVTDETKRVELKKMIDRVQARVSGAALSEPGVAPRPGAASLVKGGAGADGTGGAPLAQPRSPDEVYTSEVRKELTNVMLEQGITMQIAPEEWFTVAASQSRGGLGDPDTMTLYLSIQGKDLTALRTRQITPEEAAKRILAKNY